MDHVNISYIYIYSCFSAKFFPDFSPFWMVFFSVDFFGGTKHSNPKKKTNHKKKAPGCLGYTGDDTTQAHMEIIS